MIRVEFDQGGLPVVLGDLAVGSVAYLDADWVRADTPGEVPALVADPDGTLGQEDARSAATPAAQDGDAAAGRALLAMAYEAARAVVSRRDKTGPIEVHGRGIVSRLIRAILSDQPVLPADGEDSRPTAIVDAIGDPVRIVEMTRRLADLGTLVLVGEPLGRRLDMHLYPDIHARGLRLVGVPSARFGHDGEPGADFDESLLELSQSTLCHTSPETPLPDASWYAVHFSHAAEADSLAER